MSGYELIKRLGLLRHELVFRHVTEKWIVGM